jgi:methylmalonyl-CoA mutase cobalamin-binding subunit
MGWDAVAAAEARMQKMEKAQADNERLVYRVSNLDEHTRRATQAAASKAYASEARMQKMMLDIQAAHQEASKNAQADNERLVKRVEELEVRLAAQEPEAAPAISVQDESTEMECARSLYEAAVRERKAIVAAGGTVAELRKAYGQEVELREALAAIQ